jgi:hypothetical protein
LLPSVQTLCLLVSCPNTQKLRFTGLETWSLILREEHRLKIFVNRVQRIIFEPKRDKIIGGWRNVYNEGLHSLYFSLNIITMIKSRRMRWAGHVAHMG